MHIFRKLIDNIDICIEQLKLGFEKILTHDPLSTNSFVYIILFYVYRSCRITARHAPVGWLCCTYGNGRPSP